METITTEKLYQHYLNHPKISKDTRDDLEGAIYFALKGESFDGNEFAESAIKKGAAFAIIDNPAFKKSDRFLLVEDCLSSLQQLSKYHRKQLSIPILGITGSNGKTTTKELIAAVLLKKYNTLFTKGNLNNHIGVPLTLLEIKDEHDFAIIEMGANHQDEIDFLSNIAQPNFGLITNIGKAHLEGFGGIEGIKKGKSELYKFLAESNSSAVFINSDDEVLKDLLPQVKTIDYGTTATAYCKGSISESHPTINGSWSCAGKSGKIRSPLYGDYNFYNILAAICIGNYFEVESELIEEAIAEYDSKMNRSQLIKETDYSIYLDAYNANPTSMMLALKNFEKVNSKHKIVMLGDMFELGTASKKEHYTIIDYLETSNQIDQAVLVGENFYSNYRKREKLIFFRTTKDAKNWFQHIEKSERLFLIKGSRGMQMETIIQ